MLVLETECWATICLRIAQTTQLWDMILGRVGISMGWVRPLVGELERPFPMAERLGPPVVRAEPRTPDTSLEESVVMKRVFFFAKDAESVEE